MSTPARPLRVLAVDHTAGVTTFRKKFDALAAQSGIELTVLAPERWIENYQEVRADGDSNGSYSYRLGRVGWAGYENRAFFLSGLTQAIRATKPDILHLWEEPFSVIALQALALASVWAPHAAPIFFSSDNLSRDFRYAYRPSAFYAAVERYAHRRCVAGTAVNSEVVEVLRNKGFTKPVEVVPHGLDPADYPAHRAPRDEVLARFKLDTPIVGFAGRLLRVKGVDLLLKAFAALGERRSSLVIVGEGPERESLEALSRDLGIADRVRFFPLVPHEAMLAILSAIDVLVLPSRTMPNLKEQFGRILIEGMAAGCAVIGSSSGAIPEVVGDGGLIFEEERVDRLAEALKRALSEPEAMSRVREAGRARVAERYTWDAIARRIVEFYRSSCVSGQDRGSGA